MSMSLFFAALVGIGFLAHSAFGETCTSPDDPTCTITCHEGCLAATGDGECITQCSDTAVSHRGRKVLRGAYLPISKGCLLISY
jgi:hypothetical protein